MRAGAYNILHHYSFLFFFMEARGYAFMPFTEFVTAARVYSGGRQDYRAMIVSMLIYCLERDKSLSFGLLFRVIPKTFVLFFA
jgi:hypothetical protein